MTEHSMYLTLQKHTICKTNLCQCVSGSEGTQGVAFNSVSDQFLKETARL